MGAPRTVAVVAFLLWAAAGLAQQIGTGDQELVQIPQSQQQTTTDVTGRVNTAVNGLETPTILMPSLSPTVVTTTDAAPEVRQKRAEVDIHKLGVEKALADIYLAKVKTDAAREPLPYFRAIDQRDTAIREFWYKCAVTVLAILLVLSLSRTIPELSFSFLGSSVSWKRLPEREEPKPTSVERVRKMSESKGEMVASRLALGHRVLGRGRRERTVEVFLIGDVLGVIDRVEYHLHPAMNEAPIIATSPENAFAAQFVASAEFTLYAFAHLKENETPLKLQRYINLS